MTVRPFSALVTANQNAQIVSDQIRLLPATMKKKFPFFLHRRYARVFLISAICFLEFLSVNAQSTGYINRPATIDAGRAILDPNRDSYTSTNSTVFAGNDVANSEIPYRSVPSFSKEPFGDLRRGPSHLYSDFVPDANNVGYYFYYDGTNLLFRMRMGSVMPGSKGYSVLLDTDGKFGATGASADPNYQPATTGTNGNAGFEIEIVLETNFRIAIYNVDGSSSPTLIKSYTNWQEMSQVSIAGTFDNGDPDFFYDFYIPFSDLQAVPFNLTTSTQLRMIATTVMSPQAAIGGPKSDVYGLDDGGYKSTNDQYEAYINAQPTTTVTGSFGSMCTAAPTVNSPVGTGTVNITGTWTKSTLSGAANTATITVYKNGSSIGTILNVSSGSTWALNNVALINGDVITAKAQATGESMCLVSNSVKSSSCNSSNRPSLPALDCYSTSKGITGTNLKTGWTIHVDNITRNTADDNVANTAGLFAAPTGTSPNLTWTYSSGCSAGSPLTSGSYKVYYVDNVSGCVSEPAYVCVAGSGAGNALAGTVTVPVVTSPANGVLTTGTTSINGTADANVSLSLYVDGAVAQTTTASAGGSFTFSNLALSNGQQLYIVAELNTGTVSSSKCEAQTTKMTVSCYTTAPLINVDNNNQLTGGQAITGTSSEAVGTVIKVYTSANALFATTSVQTGGTWSTGASVAVSGTSYYATAQNGSCGLSVASGTFAAVAATTGRCGTITTPATAADASISGTITGSVSGTTVNLYLDGIKIGSTTTATTAWSINTSSLTYPLYSNGILTIGIQESGKQEQYCSSSAATISCNTGPAKPDVSPSTSSLTAGQTQTYTVSNAVIGAFYGLADGATGTSLGTGVWATSSTVTLTTNNFTVGSYTVVVKGTSLSGVSVCSSPGASASIVVGGTLPLNLLEFRARLNANVIDLSWITETEINVDHFEIQKSTDGIGYNPIGERVAANNSGRNIYSFTDLQVLPANYYRLKLIDKNGGYRFSQIAIVNTNNYSSFDVQPNPFTSSVTVNISLPSAQQMHFDITDVSGRKMVSKSSMLEKGFTSVTLNEVQQLKQGVYLLIVKDASGKIYGNQKLIKIN